MISLHSHSGQFCAHAVGTLEDVVRRAVQLGFDTFGLSEHVPRYHTKHLYPEEVGLGVAHLATQFENYLVESHRLAQLYAPQISLLVGIETEYIDEQGLDELEALLARHGDQIEYLVGSVHHCWERPIDFDKPTFDTTLATTVETSPLAQFEHLFLAYFDAQYRIMQRLLPEVIGHFDLCRLYYPEMGFKAFPAVWEKIERNVRFGIEYGALFEVNASAFRKGWSTAYPGVEVLDLILSLEGRLTLSDDSHGPAAVALHYDKTFEYLADRKVPHLWKLRSDTASQGRRKVSAIQVEGQPWLEGWKRLLESS